MNTISKMEMMWMNFRYGCLAIILVVAMVSTVSAINVGVNTLVMSPAQGLPGDTVTIPIVMNNADNIGNADMYFSSEGNNCKPVFTVMSAEKGSLTSDILFDSKVLSDDIAAISFASGKGITGSGTIAIVTVKVNSNAQGLNGKNGCVFFVTGSFYDSDGKFITVADGGSTFTLAPAVKGDGNRDGKVTSSDALAALQMAVKKIPEDLNYDMNGDKAINSNDVREILKLSVVPVSVSNVRSQFDKSGLSKLQKASPAGNGEVAVVKNNMQVAVTTTTPANSGITGQALLPGAAPRP
jgi:hypothetical protein